MEIYSVISIAIIIIILIIVLCNRYVLHVFNSIDSIFDQILSRNTTLLSKVVDDKRISKLTHKARRIMDMYYSEVAKSKEEKDTIQGFISDMSHQMKTPISSISMYSGLLSEGNLSAEEQKEFLVRMKNSTEKLQWMMDSLIKMSRLEVGTIELTPIPDYIKPTISEAISSVIPSITRKNMNVIVSEFEDNILLYDKKWTREAIINVLENAIKYSTPDSNIEVSVESLPFYTKIIITDHGIGVDKSEWNLIFKRFYRGQNVKDNEGVGLGLYLTTLILEKQGGYIMVDSTPGKKTSFSLFLQNYKTLTK